MYYLIWLSPIQIKKEGGGGLDPIFRKNNLRCWILGVLSLVETYIFSIGYFNDLGFWRLNRVQINFQTQFRRLFRRSDL